VETTGNHHIVLDETVLIKGLNRLIIKCSALEEDIKLRPVFKLTNGGYLENVKYQLTIDEVDPK
jgi:hypothetical protein